MVFASFLLVRFVPRFARETAQDQAQEQSKARFYPQLEGLRGILAVGVFLHHAVIRFFVLPQTGAWVGPPSNFYAELGHTPVLMFFFLTGFLFWSKLLRAPRLDLRPYFTARFRRLAPAYLFAMAWLFLLVAMETGFALRVSPAQLLGSVIKWLAFSLIGKPDVNGLAHTQYLIAGTPWTLAMEWRFYVLLPFLGWFARRNHRTFYLMGLFALLIWITGSIAASFALAYPESHWNPHLDYLNEFTRHLFFSFGVGICAAVMRFRWPQELPFAQTRAVTALSVAAVAGILFFLRPSPFVEPIRSLVLGLVFLALVYGNTWEGLLTSRPLLLLGTCSYSLYLCHGLVLSMVVSGIQGKHSIAELPAMAAWGLIAVTGLLVLTVSLFSYTFLEEPFFAQRAVAGIPRSMPRLSLGR